MTRTIILTWAIGVLSLIMMIGGGVGLIDLFRQEVRAPLKSYGGAISMAQLLRFVLILMHAQ
jgi:hypothetical protein